MLCEVHYLSIILEYLFMKRIVILLALITSLAYGQEQNFLEKPYYRTQVNADTLVVPDKIYLQIALSEKDSREKKSTEELYNKSNFLYMECLVLTTKKSSKPISIRLKIMNY